MTENHRDDRLGNEQRGQARLLDCLVSKSTFYIAATHYERLGIERIREIARVNGKKGGRPPKKGKKR